MNWVGGAFIRIGRPSSRSSRGLGSNVSTCDGPPSMNRKMTLRAFAGKCGVFGASGFTSAPNELSPSKAARASAPKPLAVRTSIPRRVGGAAWKRRQCMGWKSGNEEKFLHVQQHVTEIGEGLRAGVLGEKRPSRGAFARRRGPPEGRHVQVVEDLVWSAATRFLAAGPERGLL